MNSNRKQLDLARRQRAGIIGTLTMCRCTYPSERHLTASGHDEECPAHINSVAQRDLRDEDLDRNACPLSLFSLWREGDLCRDGLVWRVRCRRCGGVFGAADIGKVALMMERDHQHLNDLHAPSEAATS